MEHVHLLVKARVLNPPKTKKVINEWLKEMVEKIGMVVAAGPISSYVNQVGNLGITSAICIETSHISLHGWDEEDPPLIQSDIYSCKNFDVDVALEHFKVFDIVKLEYIVIDRLTNETLRKGEIPNVNRTER